MVAVDSVYLLQPVMVVADPYWMKQKFGLALRFQEVSDDMSTQSEINFFSVHGFAIYKAT